MNELVLKNKQFEQWQYSAAVFQSSSVAMMVTDVNLKIVQVNDAFCDITGYSQGELIGNPVSIISSGKHDGAFYRKMWDDIESHGCWSGEIWNKTKGGDFFLESITINAVFDESNNVVAYCSVFSDITKKKAADEAIKKLSFYDELSDLPNRRLLKHTLQQSIESQNAQFTLLFLDLDKFKEINDTLGHDYGDLLIKEVAIRLKHNVRLTDFVARLGGDEFTVMLVDADMEHANKVAKTILNEITNKPFQLKNEQVHISASIGVTNFPEHGTDVSSLLKHADQAMYFAKTEGRNCIREFTPEMARTAMEKHNMIQDLRHAIKNQEFELFYQPIIELKTGKVYKAEALIRWHHPTKGMIPPFKFIPVAEEVGLIVDIGNWVFEQAVKQAQKWRLSLCEHFQISVNKSPRQFGVHKNESSKWLKFMEKNNLPSECIAVEITETVLMDSKETVSQELLNFHDNGIEVSLDDFGTGHSSLAYLRKFDIDYIKIDRQFVQYLDTNPEDQILCKAIISMAKALGLKIIAEGIETESQLAFLEDISCDYGQGYLFSKPVSAKEFEQLKFLDR